MKKTQIAAAVLLMCAGVAQATVTTDGKDVVLADAGAYSFNIQGGSATVQTNGAVSLTKEVSALGKTDGAYLKGTDGNRASLTIKGSSLDIASGSANKSNDGLSRFAAWQDGNSDITIDVGTLTLGSAEKGGDRAFQMKNAGNTFTLHADKVTAYTLDGFVNAQGTAGGVKSVVNIGTADGRIGNFEGHTTYGKDDYGVALLQVNEGNTFNFYAVDALLDGPTSSAGGVMGSGGWGTLNVDVSNTLTIDGNICGSYGGLKGGNHGNTALVMNVNAGKLEMKGDINAGANGGSNSTFDRATVLNLNAKSGTVTGNMNINGKADVAVSGELTLDGDVNMAKDGRLIIGGTVAANDTKDGTVELVRTASAGAGVLNLTGNIKASANNSIVVNGSLIGRNSTVAFASPKVRMMLLALTPEAESQSGLILGDGATIDVASIQEAPVVELGSGANLTVSEDSSITELNSNGGTLTLTGGSGDTTALTVGTTNGDTTVVLDSKTASADLGAVEEGSKVTASVSSSAANSFATPEEAAQFALESVTNTDGATAATTVTVAESESNGGLTADVTEDGKLDASTIVTTVNTKTAELAKGVSANVLAFRLEMNDMNKRLGELRDSEGATGVWARVNGGKQKYQGSKNDYAQLQFGADTRVDALYGVHVGGAFSYTDGDMDLVNGSGDNKIYGLAAYGSWLGDNGSFIDVIGKVARLETDATIGGTAADFNTTAFSLSAEVGHRFAVTKSAFVEPQLELNYGYVDGKSFDTVNKASGIRTATELSHVNSLVGRLGVRAGLTCPNKKGNVYVRASVLREFEGDVTMKRGSDKVTTETGDTWFEYGIGGNYNVTPNTQIYADLERTSGADLSEPWRFVIGGRWAF